MDTPSNQADWLEPFMYYLLFDLAVFGVTIIGYLAIWLFGYLDIRVIAILLSRHSKNQSKYH